MITKSEEKITVIKNYYELKKQADAIAKQMKDYRLELFRIAGEDRAISGGGYTVTIDTRTRSSLDKKAIELQYGSEFIDSFSKVTEYEVLTVREA